MIAFIAEWPSKGIWSVLWIRFGTSLLAFLSHPKNNWDGAFPWRGGDPRDLALRSSPCCFSSRRPGNGSGNECWEGEVSRNGMMTRIHISFTFYIPILTSLVSPLKNGDCPHMKTQQQFQGAHSITPYISVIQMARDDGSVRSVCHWSIDGSGSHPHDPPGTRSAMATGPGHFWQDLYSLFQAWRRCPLATNHSPICINEQLTNANNYRHNNVQWWFEQW